MKTRPVFHSNFSKGIYKITAEIPEYWSLLDEEDWVSSPGQFLRNYVKDIIGAIDNKKEILDEIEKGKRAYLFNEKGDFINHSDLVGTFNQRRYQNEI